MLDPVSKETGLKLLDEAGAQTGNNTYGANTAEFIPVYSIADPISIDARKYYEESYSPTVSVIAGSGRSLSTAQEIWNQFRVGYHTYESVKMIFMETYGLDPEDDSDFEGFFKNIFVDSQASTQIFKKFSDTGNSAVDEFQALFGNEISASSQQAIEYVRKNFIDAPIEKDGLISYYNKLTYDKINKFKKNFIATDNEEIRKAAGIIDSGVFIKSPRDLFLTLVGAFRNKLWNDPYSRAWLVLKPSRKIGIGFGAIGDEWDFKEVDKIFAAFINPYSEYAKSNKDKEFKQLLLKYKGQGSDAGNIFSKTAKTIENRWDNSIGVLLGAVGTALDGLLSLIKTGMLQTGYGLSEIAQLSKQANILNKALNDSIYYSLGRNGSILRAVDNPFTREYGEPVVEIREPFQRMHYLSSFSHILSNQIMETTQNVSTVITAVSDGRFPVTVALDKGAPADKQTESTVETGIYFDNPIGEGFLGILHPILHPFEATRGMMKNLTGSPDELLARRIGLAHLKENIKDIYGGELLVIGNPDIRPHDLVYLADVYERMYGMFEVEQVIHHFTSELGFVTSITPNALVTVNDPAKWFMTSWIHSWMNTQAIRNDTRIYIGSIQGGNTGISSGGRVSLDALSDNLESQMMGGIQYTHGASAVIKDTVAAMTYGAFDDPSSSSFMEEVSKKAQINGNNGQLKGATAIALGVSQAIPIFGHLIWKGWTWVRDNLLDQHGAYVQYLNKNGQPMDAGLSYNQGMVVGRYHSKALLPGILGYRKKVPTSEGNFYLRTDDLLKNLGWKEVEIKELVRHVSYENAAIHSRVLDLSGLGPERTGFEPFFKVLCILDTTQGLALEQDSSNPSPSPLVKQVKEKSGVIDGDTIYVRDILSSATFTVRLEGIDTPELSVISTSDKEEALADNNLIASATSPSLRSTYFTYNSLKNRVFLLRIKEKTDGSMTAQVDDSFYDPNRFGSGKNQDRYTKDIFNDRRTLATIFYKTSEEALEKIKSYVHSLFIQHKYDLNIVESEFSKSLSGNSFLSRGGNFNIIKERIESKIKVKDYTFGINDSLITDSAKAKKLYSILVEIKIAEELHRISSKWPLVLWDEYYNDGTPYTLNWELVVNNLANVYVDNVVRIEGPSVIKAKDTVAAGKKVNKKGY